MTPGASNDRIRTYLDSNGIPGRVLVVSALTDSALLRRFCSAGSDVGCTHVVFTHLDELPTWGKLWNFLVEGPLDPLFLGTGSALSGERETDVIGALLKRTFPIN